MQRTGELIINGRGDTSRFPTQTKSRQPQPLRLHGSVGRSVSVRRGALTSAQMRTISKEGIPGICKDTLIDESLSLEWEIVSPTGEQDATALYFTLLLQNANDGEGFDAFKVRLAEDVLTTLQGGHFEVALNAGNVPLAVYNVDSNTIFQNPEFPEASDQPWLQRVYTNTPHDPTYFTRPEMGHIYWHAVSNWSEQRRNRCPIELAYYYICILAAADDWNMELLSDPLPAGVFVAPGATQEEAEAFQASWDYALEGGGLRDIAILYGMELGQAQHVKFTRPPTDMAFEITNHWYTSLVAAAFEMSILDISILTKVSTKAGAESQERKSQQQGQKKLRRVIQEAIERWLLPEGYKFKWIVPKPEDEATQAEAAERRARAVNYYVMAFGPEIGYDLAKQAGLITTPDPTRNVEHLKSGARRTKYVQRLIAKSDLFGYVSLSDWEIITKASLWLPGPTKSPPLDLWGQELYDWLLTEYGNEMRSAMDLWADEAEEDPELAAVMLYEHYKDSLQRAATRAYVAGKQRDASTKDDAFDIASAALTLAEIALIYSYVNENTDHFIGFSRDLIEYGIDYAKRGFWRAGQYVKYLRRFFLLGVTEMADPVTDLIRLSHGGSEEPCVECPPRWGTYTVDEYRAMGGPPPNWCVGWDNCTCHVEVVRNAQKI